MYSRTWAQTVVNTHWKSYARASLLVSQLIDVSSINTVNWLMHNKKEWVAYKKIVAITENMGIVSQNDPSVLLWHMRVSNMLSEFDESVSNWFLTRLIPGQMLKKQLEQHRAEPDAPRNQPEVGQFTLF